MTERVMAGPERAIPVVALDVPDAASARALVARLGDGCDFYKVGLELFAAEGPDMVRWLRGEGKRVFVDLKLHDIPNTVRSAARSVARLGASLLTVHAGGGSAMVQAAVDGAREEAPEGGPACEILAVTLLTSLEAETVAAVWGRPSVDVSAEVVRLAGVARAGSAAGVVCSGQELAALRAAHGDALRYLVPGLRPAGSGSDDQARVVTPGAAAADGAGWLILGRAVTAAPDPAAALAAIRADVALALGSQVG